VKLHIAAVATATAAALLPFGLGTSASALTRSASLANSSARPVLTIGYTYGSSSLNPTLAQENVDSLAYQSITHLAPDGQVVPGLAVSWHYVGSGNETFEFTLRPNAHFSDGTEVTAQAVKAWMDYYFFIAKGIQIGDLPMKSISTMGPYTVVLHLKAPIPDVPFLLSEVLGIGFIGGPKGLAQPSSLAAGTDGAGPYVAVPSQTVSGTEYVFVPNKYYYDPSAVHFSKVIVKIITTPTTMLEAIEAGQLDVAAGDPTTVAAANAAGLNVVSAPDGIDILEFLDRAAKLPSGQPNPLASLQVREAINYAIDRQAITQAIMGKNGTATDEYPTTDGYVQSYADYYPYDPAKAKSLLAQAGYPNGLTINVAGEPNGSLGEPTFQAVAQNLAAVGINLNITQYPDVSKWVTDVLADKYPADTVYEEGFDSTSVLYQFNFAPGALLNFGGWADPVLNELESEAVVAKDPEPYFEAESKRIVTEAYLAPIFIVNSFYYTQKDIAGVAYSGAARAPWPDDWYEK
jgi:peptide/nickel transport system substrate-binding protein